MTPLSDAWFNPTTIKAWLAERSDHIDVFHLPSYAPELNPDERLNADMKHAIGSKVPVRTKSNGRPPPRNT